MFRASALASRDFSALESVSHVFPGDSLFVAAPKSKTRVGSVKFALIQFRRENQTKNTSLEVLISLYLTTLQTEN